MIDKIYYSRAKLLISGEYLVLRGAKAFAVPLKLGQFLICEPKNNSENLILWSSYDINGKWFEAEFNHSDFQIISSSNQQIANRLQNLFIHSRKLNPDFLRNKFSYKLISRLEFDRFWGLGSSSTLISNISFWADINPYNLLDNAFGGSGYDIACSRSESPLIYSILNREEPQFVSFNPEFRDNIYFAWLGNKMDTAKEISVFNERNVTENQINAISDISIKLPKVQTLDMFIQLLKANDEIVSEIIEQESVFDKHFYDFDGYIKNSGAWGGDFVLIASKMPEKEIINYLSKKNITTIFRFSELCK